MSFYARLVRFKPKDTSDAAFAVHTLGIRKEELHRWKTQHQLGHDDYLPPKRQILKCASALGVDPAVLSFESQEREEACPTS